MSETTPFIVGASRSGTTLLRLMLDAHSQLAIGPETHFVPALLKTRSGEEFMRAITEHPRFADQQMSADELHEAMPRPFDASNAMRAFYRLYAASRDKKYSGDKTPRYVRLMPEIQAALPETRFIHLIRDGRDAALSGLATGIGPGTLEEQAIRWRQTVRKGRTSARALLPGSYMEVFYEDLVREPAKVLERVCKFVGLSYEPRMLAYHERAEERLKELNHDIDSHAGNKRMAIHQRVKEPPNADKVGAYKSQMSADELQVFEENAGDLLQRLGYPTSI